MADFTEGAELAALLDRANALGIVHTEWADDGDGGFIERRSQDVTPLLDLNKERQLDNVGWTPSRDLLFIADIPFAVAELWMREHGISMHEFMQIDPGSGWLKRKLEDPANLFLRVYPGRI